MGATGSTGAKISGGEGTSPAAPADEGFRSGIAHLSEYGLLRVHGADAAPFLQAQLTNDVASIGEHEVRLAGYCSVKGRLMASFWVWRDPAGQAFWLACSRDIASSIAKRLAMFVLRAKVKVEDVSDVVALLGIVRVGDAVDVVPDPAAHTTLASAVAIPPVVIASSLAASLNPARVETAAELGIARALLPVAAGSLQETLQALQAEGARLLPMAAWRRLEVLSGIARIEAANQELFVPQMVNFELVEGVNFRKGCYPGQEVVARSQYLGKLKRRMFLGLGAGAVPSSGTDVHPAEASPATAAEAATGTAAQPVGQVVLAAPLDGERFVVLFESMVSAVPPESQSPEAALRIGTSPISRLPLPYPLPSPAASPGSAPRVPDAAT